jgi:hypothetical protein
MRLSIHAALAAAIAALAFATPVNAEEAAAPAAQKTADATQDDKDVKPEPKHEGNARPAHEPQTHKMVRCNEEAGKKQLRGEERRAFMSACLKN